MPDLLVVKDLKTHIRMRHSTVEAVDGLSLTIKAGETVGLVGESGSGKSMTGMSIMRLLPPGGHRAGGTIALEGRDISAVSEREMRRIRGNDIAMVFQDPMTSLNPTMSIGEQIAESVRVHRGASATQGMERAADVLALVGMPKPKERLEAYPHQLSGGLRQRVVIAMALACEPRLLIADEPTTALDVTIQSQILDLLDDLKSRLNMAMLLITHDMGVIARCADRTMVMYAGRIVESADTPTVFRHMHHPYTQALLASIPDLDTDRNDVLYSIPGLPPDLSRPHQHACRFAPRCRFAQDLCRQEEPTLLAHDRNHEVACFFPVAGLFSTSGSADARRDWARPSGGAGDAPVAADQPLLVLDHVVKAFPITAGVLQRRVGSVKAVSDVSFSVSKGDTFGLVGESGCGKTTLGRLIVALEKPDSGSVRFGQDELSAMRGRLLRRKRRDVQLMFQDPYASLDPRMRISSTLREPLAVQHIGSRHDQDERMSQALSDVGLAPRSLGLYPHEFSGGQRQRIGLARALSLEPQLIVADEPVSALDASIQSQVLNLMRRLQNEKGLTYVLISHDLSVVRYLANRIGVMYLGKLIEIGTADDVYGAPAHPYTHGLLSAVPVADPMFARRKGVAIMGDLPSAVDPPSGCRFRTRCPRAAELCATTEPPLRPFGVSSHLAACHFPLETPLQPAAAGVSTDSPFLERRHPDHVNED
jgi:oligopeptide/dipeptide ABC transporter ATP-binding protein